MVGGTALEDLGKADKGKADEATCFRGLGSTVLVSGLKASRVNPKT